LETKLQESIFVELINQNQGIIHKVCRMYCQANEERADLFQEIVLQLWRAYPRFEYKSKITTWMYQIALNTAITAYRKSQRQPQKADLEIVSNIAEHTSEHFQEEQQLLYKAIAQLNDAEKALMTLYLEDVPTDEIAEIIGITANNVRVKMNRIREKLKKILQAWQVWN
jgi:RNA polymerase sigma-70 factor (ECF subfamily)